MAEVTIDQVPPKVRDMFNKGFVALERGNLEYAIDLLATCVETVPGFLQARKFLRAAEIQHFKTKKESYFGKLTSGMSGMPAYLTAMAKLRSGKADKALEMGEALLRNDPLNLKYLTFFADAAVAAQMPEAATQTLEVAREHFPEDGVILETLGHLYTEIGQPKEAREALEKLCELRPNDPAAMKALKDASARESMAKDGWAQVAKTGGSYRDMIKDSKEAVILEQESKAVKSDKDIEALVADVQNKIKAEPGNINNYRNLARLYSQQSAFKEAIEILTKALVLAPGDAELDNAVSATKLAEFNHAIAALKAAGDSAAAEAKESARDQFRFDDLSERVKRYPNDPRLRFDFGVMLCENEYYNEAIQQLQVAQKSLKHRVQSLYYMAMCFKAKKQYDLAAMQLEGALAELVVMDDSKKNVLYEMGDVAELMNDKEKAANCYKQIYQVDIGFKDISQKIEKVYSR